MARRLVGAAFLALLLGLVSVANSCIQPVDPEPTATESFDLTVPDTPSLTPSAVPVSDSDDEGPIFLFTSPPIFTFVLTPGAPARFRIDGGTWNGPALGFTDFDASTLTPGRHRIEVQERDDSGNWSETYTYRFVVDMEPPAPPSPSPSNLASTANLTPRFYWYGDRDTGSRQFEANISGPGVSESFTIDFTGEAAGKEFSASPTTFTGSGTVTFSIRERDLAGNWSPYTDITMTIDVAGPIFTSQPPSPTNQTGNNSWSWQSSGAANADQHYEYELRTSPLPGTLIESGTRNGSPVSFTGEYVPEGTYQLMIRESRNDLTDWSLWVESDVLAVDTTAPATPTLTTTPPALGTDDTPSFAWSGSGEPGAEYTYEITGPTTVGPASTSTTTYTAPTLADGSYTFTIYETDAAGNTSGSDTATFGIDATAPPAPQSVVVNTPYVTPANQNAVQFSWVGSGEAGNTFHYEVLSGGSPVVANTTTAESCTLDLSAVADGTLDFSVYETDGIGNDSPVSSVTFIKDTVNPTLSLGTTPLALGTDNTPTFTWSGVDSGSGIDSYTYTLSGPDPVSSTNTAATSRTFTALSDGAYTFEIHATDAGGNVSTTVSYSFTIDTTPPGAPTGVTSTSLNGISPNRYVTTANTTFTWSSGGGGNGVYRYSLDGGTTWSAAAAGTSRTISTPRAEHNLVLQERDAAGNWSLSSSPVVFLAQPVFLSRVDLNVAVGPASTGTLYVAIRRGATELGIASMDQPSNRGFSDWWSFNYGDIPVLPNEVITIAARRSDDQVLNDNYTTWWSADGPIGTNVYPYGEGTGGADDVDMTFRTYTRTTPGGAETLDQQQTELLYGYRLFPSDRTQTFTVQAP